MSFSLFDLNQGGNALEMSDAKIKSYLSSELGFSAAKTRNTKILTIMENPTPPLAAYNKALDDLVLIGAGHYKNDYEKLLSLGLSDNVAQNIAKQKAQAFINSEKDILDFEYPLINDINTLASAKAKTAIHIPTQQRGIGRKRK